MWWKWGWCTADYEFILPLCLIKWLLVPLFLLGYARMDVPPLCFIHSSMRSVVSCRLGYLVLPNLLVVRPCYIVRKKFLTGPQCIPWLWLIHPCSVGEPQDLTGPPYIQWFCLGYLFSSKKTKGLPRYLWWVLYFIGCPWYVMWCTVFYPDL